MVDSTSGGVSVHPSSESSLVVEVKKGQHLDLVLMELKDYNMNVHYRPGKANNVVDALSRMSMGSTTHIKDANKELVKDIHRLS